jgi:tetratricopeptide (TPR) repeat protein
MGFGKAVDAASCPLWKKLNGIILWLLLAVAAAAREESAQEKIPNIKALYDGKRWEEVLNATKEAPAMPGDFGLYRGLALTHLQRWDEAEAAFRASLTSNPGDARLMVELGGLAYRKKDFARAKAYLRHALALNGQDDYANNLLASIYFLEGNLEAALKYWNRIGKPRLSDLRFQPQPQLKPILLDRAFSFRRGSVWSDEEYLETRTRLEQLEVFQSERFDLQANEDDSFDLVFIGAEKPCWQDSPWIAGANLLSGLPYLTVYPEFPNIGRNATNWNSMLRWDDQKRRYASELSGPLRDNPAWRYRVDFDFRDENWNLTNTLLPAMPGPAEVNLRQASLAVKFEGVAQDGWNWSAGPVYAYRDFRNLIGLPTNAAPFFTGGSNLGLQASASRYLLRYPQRRFTVDGTVSGEAGTFFSGPLGRYSKVDGDLDSRWLPKARGDDYETLVRLRSGGTFGNVPLDELYVLGFDRDTDLWMRGHPGLLSGQKGNAPLGREYVLLNSEVDKVVYRAPFVTFRVGPFLDSGRTYDPSAYFGLPKWMWDTGGQLKIRVLGSMEFVLGYGKDLRSGKNSFFTTLLPNKAD